ncbi:hypothetical protein BM536_036085 [Streptomyces phaeoluteigriseus]|uniref:Uncharacterized protein n=1 Tax=Streptomyces phaeoluteigriseus TaxID=114686 RepID=A0A1V6MI75_9ACTN|nr:hypothetical protein BM536_036085 [Streptomyces phaeoluteigriseus]
MLGDSDEPGLDPAWIALVPGDLPFRHFAPGGVFHFAGSVARPDPHRRDYGVAKIAHGACCSMLHPSAPTAAAEPTSCGRRCGCAC